MPHDPEEVIAFAMREYARQTEELAQLRIENNQLRNLLVTMLRTVKEVELNLQLALDKDLTRTEDRTI